MFDFRRDGRAAEGTTLLTWHRETYRGFESLSLLNKIKAGHSTLFLFCRDRNV